MLAREALTKWCDAVAGTDFEGTWKANQHVYILPWGDERRGRGVIYFRSADNPNSLEAGQFDGAWIDEGGQIKYDAWIAIRGRTGQKESPVLITTTPYTFNWLYHDFVRRFLDGEKNYYVRQWASIMNPVYSVNEYNDAKASMSEARAAMRYDGLFTKPEGLVYPEFDRCILPGPKSVIPQGHHIGGIDFGWDEPFCGLSAVVYLNEAGKSVLYVYYERYKRLTMIETHAAALPRTPLYFADPSEPELIRKLNNSGIRTRKAKRNILFGVDAVNSRIYKKTLEISPECKAVIQEAENYMYPKEEDTPVGEKPVDNFNHAMDALRYMVVGADMVYREVFGDEG